MAKQLLPLNSQKSMIQETVERLLPLAKAKRFWVITNDDLRAPIVRQLKKLDKQTLLNVVARCVALKAQVVAGDERDSGQYRILLNYGHTIAHALETISNYQLLHGEAVAIGMAVEARIAVRMGIAQPEVEVRQNRLLQQFGLGELIS